MKKPELRVALDVGEGFSRLRHPGQAEMAQMQVSRQLEDLMETLGIPGKPVVTIGKHAGAAKVLRLTVNDEVMRYPDELLLNAYSYLSGAYLEPETDLAQVEAWLNEPPAMEDLIHDHQVSFAALVSSEILKRRPGALFGSAQIGAYLASLPLEPAMAASTREKIKDIEGLRQAFRTVLDLRISLADRETVAEILADNFAKERQPADIAEELISVLSPDSLQICLAPGYLRQITMVDDGKERDIFNLLREGLFYELGLVFPRFEFVEEQDIRDGCLAFRINHLRTLPRRGLNPTASLVAESADALADLGITARTIVNPANYNPCSLVESQDLAKVAQRAYTWTPFGHLVLCMSAELREKGACFVDLEFTRRQLDALEWGFPDLVLDASSKATDEQLTRLLRGLAAEEISIRDLWLILGAVIDFDYIVIPNHAQYIVFDDRLPSDGLPDTEWLNDPANLISFVRMRMKRYLSHKYTRGRASLEVYLLDPEIESIVSQFELDERGRDGRFQVDQVNEILAAVHRELQESALAPVFPAILTTTEVRPRMRTLLEAAYPRLPVLAYQELSAETSIQPLARIELERRVDPEN